MMRGVRRPEVWGTTHRCIVNPPDVVQVISCVPHHTLLMKWVKTLLICALYLCTICN